MCTIDVFRYEKLAKAPPVQNACPFLSIKIPAVSSHGFSDCWIFLKYPTPSQQFFPRFLRDF